MGKRANLNYKLMGVGINDADYKVRDCPYYSRWTSMLKRCYSESYHKRKPTYVDCVVCEDWHLFSNFKKWMELQDWEGKQLDKDFLIKGNKLYSPTTCIFISGKVNSFLAIYSSSTKKSGLPIGVSAPTGRSLQYSAQGSDGSGVKKNLGSFNTILEAQNVWKAHKVQIARDLLLEEVDNRVVGKLEEVINTLLCSIESDSIITREDLLGNDY